MRGQGWGVVWEWGLATGWRAVYDWGQGGTCIDGTGRRCRGGGVRWLPSHARIKGEVVALSCAVRIRSVFKLLHPHLQVLLYTCTLLFGA